MGIFEDIPILSRIVDLALTMVLVIVISALIGLILAVPVMWLWNYVFGELYKITWLQAWALSVLSSILIGRSGNGKKS